MARIISYLVLIPALTWSLACGEAGQGGAEALAQWRVSAEPIVEIGGADEREGYALFEVAGATRLSDGRIAILNARSEVLFYDPDGVFLTSAGREGQGPGEWQRIMSWARAPGDTLLVFSVEPGLSWVSPTGEVTRQQRFNVFSPQVPCRIAEGNRIPLHDGALLMVFEDNSGMPGCLSTPPGRWRQSGLIARTQAGSSSIDTLDMMPATERNGGNYAAFGHTLLVGVAATRVFLVDTGSDSIVSYNHQGGDRLALPVPFEAELVPASSKTVEVRRLTRSDGTTRIGEPYSYPDRFPRVARIVPSSDGHLWLQPYPTNPERPISSYRLDRPFRANGVLPVGGATWTVLDAQGVAIGSIRTPDGLSVVEVGSDYVLGMAYDELDRASVLVYALIKSD